MLDEVRLLFREVVDLSLEDRETYYQKHHIPADLRAEVEQFLAFDGGSNHLLTESVAVCASGLPDATQEEPKERRCGPYRLLHLIGSGGMGSVYLAQRADGEVEQRVAIKLLKYGAEDPAFHSRFLQERQILAKLSHPAIGRLLDAGHTADGQPYLAIRNAFEPRQSRVSKMRLAVFEKGETGEQLQGRLETGLRGGGSSQSLPRFAANRCTQHDPRRCA